MKKKHVIATVLGLFVLASALSVWLMGKVNINYNISDYLDDSTETKISLNIIKDEFGATGDVQVMVEDIDAATAISIRDQLKALPGVLNVTFNPDSAGSYKDGDALFVILTDGDEYSDESNQVVADVKALLDDTFEGKTNYGGTVVEKAGLRKAIQSEIVLILGIALGLVVVIMLLTSKSWLEPIILLLASGVAVLLNMGTNAIFGEISYITNAVAAILQLALSIDYSIVLLHQYRAASASEPDQGRAMLQAVKEVAKPVSASALTTMAGLLALLFMTLKIGFDIGIVLMKGIVISAITSLTLLPVLLLLCDKLLQKTKKKDLVLKGAGFCRFSIKSGKLVAPIAIVLIIACAILQAGNSYIFTDSKDVNQRILDRFGKNSTLMVVYPNGEDNHEKETALAERLAAYQTADGKTPLKSHTAYSNTVRELYDVEKTAKTLNIPEADVEMLLTMYHLYGDSTKVQLTPEEFVRYTHDLLGSDEDIRELAGESTANTLALMLTVDTIMNGEHTAEELHELISDVAGEDAGISLLAIRQMYGLYLYDSIESQSVDFRTMLSSLVAAAEDPDAAALMGEEVVSALTQLSEGVDTFMTLVDTPVDQATFRSFAKDLFGMDISARDTAWLFLGYYFLQDQAPQETIPLVSLIEFLVEQEFVTAPEAIDVIDGLIAAAEDIPKSYTYEEFLPALTQIATALTGEEVALSASADAAQQLYILHFNRTGAIPADATIPGRTFVEYLQSVYPENQVVAQQLSEDTLLKLEDLCLVDAFLAEETVSDYKAMATRLGDLQASLQSITSDATLSEDMVSGVYIKYAIDRELELAQPVMAFELLDFVAAHMEQNQFLKARMTDEHRAKVVEAQDNIRRAESLFIAEKHSRMLLSVDLPAESAESSAFVEYLSEAVSDIFGTEAHIAGEMVSTYDLQVTFDDDNRLITIVTLISILLIILLVFRSLSLPVILVAVIQGAIWITMSTSLLTGPMFFMSYIMASCILMGATIDYGILMSTNYIRFRETMDKRDALFKAVESAMPTIFTSGMILTICGFVVGFVASQTSISTVGFLLGKGTLVSILVITLVLPSLLYLLDGFILKFTMGARKQGKQS